MCTAVHFNKYFGRNLDLEITYGEKVLITPENFPLTFRQMPRLDTHQAIIGMGIVVDNYPLYFDGVNKAGLAAAGLNFPNNACYMPPCHGADNLAPFELIPYILAKCETVKEAKKLLTRINIIDTPFSKEFPNTPLHWMIADKDSSIVVEPLRHALKIYENPVGVLTNNPTFDYHLTNLSNYMNVTSAEPQNRFSDKINLTPYSRGMGGLGIPGDLSSTSRFVRAAFTLLNSKEESLSQFFHILTSVEQQKGCARVGDKYEYTLYSSCCDMEKATYYYTTYKNRRITAVNIDTADLNSTKLTVFPLNESEDIFEQK